MKPTLLILVLLVILLAACRTATPVETEAPAPMGTLAPSPTQAVTTPAITTLEPTGSGPYPGAVEPTKYDPNVPAPYPGPEEGGATVEWEEATRLILAGEVAQLTQYDNLVVIMILKDGQTMNTRQPAMDAVLALIDECGDLCADVQIPIQ